MGTHGLCFVNAGAIQYQTVRIYNNHNSRANWQTGMHPVLVLTEVQITQKTRTDKMPCTRKHRCTWHTWGRSSDSTSNIQKGVPSLSMSPPVRLRVPPARLHCAKLCAHRLPSQPPWHRHAPASSLPCPPHSGPAGPSQTPRHQRENAHFTNNHPMLGTSWTLNRNWLPSRRAENAAWGMHCKTC